MYQLQTTSIKSLIPDCQVVPLVSCNLVPNDGISLPEETECDCLVSVSINVISSIYSQPAAV